MSRLFDSALWYNWSPNPGNPGLGDSVVFLIRNLFFGLLFCMPFVAIGHGDIGTLLWSSASEEHARITWMVNARRMFKAGVRFAIFLAIFEFLAVAIPTGALENASAFLSLASRQVPPTLLHFSTTLLGFIILSRGASPLKAWFFCAIVHLVYNGVIVNLLFGR